jgi:hypothetical protein
VRAGARVERAVVWGGEVAADVVDRVVIGEPP